MSTLNRLVKLPSFMLRGKLCQFVESDNPVHSRIALGKKPEWDWGKGRNRLIAFTRTGFFLRRWVHDDNSSAVPGLRLGREEYEDVLEWKFSGP